MPKTLIKSKLHSNKQKPQTKQELNKIQSNLISNLNLLIKNFYLEVALFNINKF